MAGIPYSTYRTYETGAAEPKATALVALARALKTDPNTLLGWRDRDADSFLGAAMRHFRQREEVRCVHCTKRPSEHGDGEHAFEPAWRGLPTNDVQP